MCWWCSECAVDAEAGQVLQDWLGHDGLLSIVHEAVDAGPECLGCWTNRGQNCGCSSFNKSSQTLP